MGGARKLQFHMKCDSIQKILGNEVYYTILLTLEVKIMLCHKLHCQIFFELHHISYEILRFTEHLEVHGALGLRSGRERSCD